MRSASLLAILLGACGARVPAADAALDADAGRLDAGLDGGVELDASFDGGPEDAPAADAGAGALDDALARLASPGATSAELDALVREVGLAQGWPLRSGTRWLFVTRWDAAPSGVALVSDLNAWSTTASPAERAASGVHYWAVLDDASFTVPPEGAKYKWYGAPDVYRAPPEATAYGYDAFGEHGWVRPPTDLAYFERFPAFGSSPLGAPRTIRARIPASFDPARARTLLLHDGQNVFDPDAAWGGWRAQDALSAPAYADVLAIAVDNGPDRFDAYTHVPDDIGSGLIGGRAGDYRAMLRDSVLPFARARYGVEARGGSLVIGGSSLGGLVSLYVALVEPGLAGCVIAMSPTLGWGALRASGAGALVHRFESHGPVAIYLDSGGGGTCSDPDGDGVQEDSDDSDNFCVTSQLRDRLVELGYSFEVDLFHWHEPNALHNEAAWAARLPHALDSCAAAGWSR